MAYDAPVPHQAAREEVVGDGSVGVLEPLPGVRAVVLCGVERPHLGQDLAGEIHREERRQVVPPSLLEIAVGGSKVDDAGAVLQADERVAHHPESARQVLPGVGPPLEDGAVVHPFELAAAHATQLAPVRAFEDDGRELGGQPQQGALAGPTLLA